MQDCVQDMTAKDDYTTYDTWAETDTISYTLNDTKKLTWIAT
jgi:hypothetical protein